MADLLKKKLQCQNCSFIMFNIFQGQDSRLKKRTFLKPASLGYGVNKQH